MNLGIRLLANVQDVNHLAVAQYAVLHSGEDFPLYFQLVDLDQGGIRYVPGVGGLTVVCQCQALSIDDSKVVTRFATQPFVTYDPSIFLLSLLATDLIDAGTANFRVTLTEGTNTPRAAYRQGAFRIASTQQNATQPGGASTAF
jgi:hypothetical protein